MTALINAAPSRPPATPRVSVIVPAYKNVEYTLRCVLYLVRSKDQTPFEIILADDRSPDGSGEYLIKALTDIRGVTVYQNAENLGFLRSCNAAAQRASGEHLFFLNNDTVVIDGWLDELVATVDRESNVGLAGAKLVYPNGLLQEAGGVIWEGGACANYGRLDDPGAPQYNYLRDADYISGAAILVTREAWDAVGGFSDDLAPAYYEDTDLAMKLRAAGYRVVYQPRSTVVHFEGVTSGTDLSSGVKRYQAINKDKFEARWADTLSGHGEEGDLSRKCVDRSARARILIYDAETPKPDKDSGSVTAFHYMEILCRLGYRVTFVPENLSWDGKYSVALQRLGVEVIHGPYHRSATDYILHNAQDFDLFILSRAPIGGMFIGRLKAAAPEKPIVFDTVDLHHLRETRLWERSREQADFRKAMETREIELSAIRLADATIVVSEFEVDYLRDEIGPFPHVVIPLIYDEYERKVGFEPRADIAFVGGFRHPPNVDAATYLADEIWPLFREFDLDAKLHIIGSNMPPEISDLADEDIIVHGFVKDLEGFLKNVRATVAPLRYGAGVKGKVGQSLRLGVPVVGTPVATEGMGLRGGEHVLVGSDPAGVASALKSVYTDAELWERLSVAGQAFVRERFGVAEARARLEAMCSSLTGAARRAP